MKRVLSLALLAAMLVSCGETNTVSQDTVSTDTTEAETTQSVSSILGFEKEDNGGKIFTVYADSNKSYDFDATEVNGDVVNDAVYAKNCAVEDYLGITLNFIYGQCDWAVLNDFHARITNDIASGSGEIDLVSSIMVCTMPIVSNGYFLDGKSLDVDFSHAWWLSDMYGRFSIADKLFGFLGDYSLSFYKDMSVIFFNKRIYEEFDAPNLYELVRNNEWTLDKFLSVCSDMEIDLNGDGSWSMEDDQLTYLGERVPCGTWQTALELQVVEIDKTGTPVYLGLTEKFQKAYDKLHALYLRDDIMTLSTIDDHTYTSMKTFANGTVATMSNFLYSTEYMRDMKDDYGIVPIPKYDENQEKYIAQLGTSTEMLFVPVTTKDIALTSKVMECLGYYMKELAVPKYYEIALKEKYARDEDIREMLDIIRDGAALDFLFVYGTTLTSTPFQYFRFINRGVDNLASDFASKESSFLSSLEKLTAAFEELG